MFQKKKNKKMENEKFVKTEKYLLIYNVFFIFHAIG